MPLCCTSHLFCNYYSLPAAVFAAAFLLCEAGFKFVACYSLLFKQQLCNPYKLLAVLLEDHFRFLILLFYDILDLLACILSSFIYCGKIWIDQLYYKRYF